MTWHDVSRPRRVGRWEFESQTASRFLQTQEMQTLAWRHRGSEFSKKWVNNARSQNVSLGDDVRHPKLDRDDVSRPQSGEPIEGGSRHRVALSTSVEQ